MTIPSPDVERAGREDRPRTHERAGTRTGVDRARQATAAVLGSGLLVRGLRRRSLRGVATALVGGWLLSRAVGGREGVARTVRSRTTGDPRTAHRPGATPDTAVSRSITIGRPADELYEAWRDPDRFSRVMGHVADVSPADEDRFHWTLHGPRGRDVSWETRIVEAEPGEVLRWETTEGAALPNEGTVRFRPAPGDRGTIVTLSVDFDPPGGALGDATLEQLDVVPKMLAGEALRRFKSLAETGEIQTLEGNVSARGTGDRL